MTYTINQSTEKAHSIENSDGVKFWIQRRWMRADGSLTPAGIAAEKEAEERRAESAIPVKLPIDWQNEKSVGVDYRAVFSLSSSVDADDKRVRAFFPKSMIEIVDGLAHVPAWLEKKKRAEALEKSNIHPGYSIISTWSE